LLPQISTKLTQQFADCLHANMQAEEAQAQAPADGSGAAAVAAPAPVAAKPVGGIGLGLSAIWSVIADFFRRLFGGGSKA